MSKGYYSKRINVRGHTRLDPRTGKRVSVGSYPRNQRYRQDIPVSRVDALKKFNQKSTRAKATDRSKTSKKVFEEPNEYWLEHMDKSDVKDIDTSQKEVQDEMKIIYKLEQFGGKHWEKYGKNRVYFNPEDLAKMRGYEWDLYKTGNISSATKKGEHISNSEMKRVLRDLNCKLYYDLEDNQFHYQTGIGTGKEHTEKAIKNLRNKIKQKVK